jgi:hypothetical protein
MVVTEIKYIYPPPAADPVSQHHQMLRGKMLPSAADSVLFFPTHCQHDHRDLNGLVLAVADDVTGQQVDHVLGNIGGPVAG